MGYEKHELTLTETKERLEFLARENGELEFIVQQLDQFIERHPDVSDEV